jgi:hypothetical protein
MSDTKLCVNGARIPGCGQERPLSDFWRSAKGAPLNQCKECKRKYRRLLKNYPETVRPSETAACTSCGETKPRGEFAFEQGSGGKLKGTCKACDERQYSKISRVKLLERNREALPDGPPKACSGCKQIKPLGDFVVARDRHDGRSSRCRECDKAYQRARRKKKKKKSKICLQCSCEFVPEGRELLCPPCSLRP